MFCKNISYYEVNDNFKCHCEPEFWTDQDKNNIGSFCLLILYVKFDKNRLGGFRADVV